MSLKTRAQWLSWAEAELKSAATQQPRAEAEFLLAAALQSSRTRVLAFSSEPAQCHCTDQRAVAEERLAEGLWPWSG